MAPPSKTSKPSKKASEEDGLGKVMAWGFVVLLLIVVVVIIYVAKPEHQLSCSNVSGSLTKIGTCVED